MKISWKNTFIVVLLLQLSYIPCDVSGDNTSHSEKSHKSRFRVLDLSNYRSLDKFTGWGGAPGSLDENSSPENTEPKDWFYSKIKAKASIKSIQTNSHSMKINTCQSAAEINGVSSSFQSFLNEWLTENSPDLKKGKITLSVPDNRTSYTCSFQREGNSLTQECSGSLKGHGIAGCWTLEGRDWEECECITYIHIPGGKASLRNRIRLN